MARACKDCHYFVELPPDRAEGFGKCHRYPPPLGPVSPASYSDRFPIVDESDWCGEFDNPG